MASGCWSVMALLTAQWFRAIDRDGNGMLDAAELQRALALGNLRFSLQLTSHMIRCARRQAM
jgi:Ca2+-binding EF-hand superfamily protein